MRKIMDYDDDEEPIRDEGDYGDEPSDEDLPEFLRDDEPMIADEPDFVTGFKDKDRLVVDIAPVHYKDAEGIVPVRDSAIIRALWGELEKYDIDDHATKSEIISRVSGLPRIENMNVEMVVAASVFINRTDDDDDIERKLLAYKPPQGVAKVDLLRYVRYIKQVK